MIAHLLALLLLACSVCALSEASSNDIAYSACPLLKAYYPKPHITTSVSKAITQSLDATFDNLTRTGMDPDFGAVMANTTSFSVVLFSGTPSVGRGPIFYEYHYTSPKDKQDGAGSLDRSTLLPTGDLTMVATVYAWLAMMGGSWDEPITTYLPELKNRDGVEQVHWEDVTVGSLAGQMSGLGRTSGACALGKPCEWQAFKKSAMKQAPIFLTDTTPVVSHTAFQLLAFAMQRHQAGRHGADFASLLKKTLWEPLNMTKTFLLGDPEADHVYAGGVDPDSPGEPAALSLLSTPNDLALLGQSMLSSTLVSSALTRRWLATSHDTSNLRNGVGRPWEVYRSGAKAISPIVDALTKSGNIGLYASYFGLVPELDVGFAVLAHDSSVADGGLDLNVYADIVSEASEMLVEAAAKETALLYAGQYSTGKNVAVVNLTKDGPGLQVAKLEVQGHDVRAQVAQAMGVKESDLDFRLYPTNVIRGNKQQWVSVFQDMKAPVDAGTPTCVTWQEVERLTGVKYLFEFDLGKEESARSLGYLEGPKMLKQNETKKSH